jgi:hypothetical protein
MEMKCFKNVRGTTALLLTVEVRGLGFTIEISCRDLSYTDN